VEAEALVGASRSEVWRLFDDIAGMPAWIRSVREILYVSGPARAGTVYRERTAVLGVSGTAQWEIVEYRRPSRQVHVSIAGGIERVRILSFEGRGTGTLVHQATDLYSDLPGPLGWIHESLAAIPAGRSVRAAVTGAKRAFEGDPPR
jgi:uncharacterized protein YndB with AHSA1/START domain